MNLYAYVANNPLKYTDPSGHKATCGELNKVAKEVSQGWDMKEGGGYINGRWYSQHAMERMAPDTLEVRAELARRAEKSLKERGFKLGTREYMNEYKKYLQPRNIPPMVVEDAINSTPAVFQESTGNFIHETVDVKVIVNSEGSVVTVMPK